MAILGRVLVVLVACVAAVCVGWGDVGHQTVAAIATNLLSSAATAKVKTLLRTQTMVEVSTWADEVRKEKAWAWSAVLHYIDTPDFLCTYDYTRDCKDSSGTAGMCVAGAIHNYSTQVGNIEFWNALAANKKTNISAGTAVDALKFLIHFMGDIHQPLHVGFTTDRGGNSISVTYYDEPTNLHAVWDDGIIGTLLSKNFSGDQNAWADELTKWVSQGGVWYPLAQRWAQCSTGAVDCTTVFATEGIKYACSDAYECVASGDQPCPTEQVKDGSALSDDYYEATAPIVSLRIAQAGVRLAALLNTLFP